MALWKARLELPTPVFPRWPSPPLSVKIVVFLPAFVEGLRGVYCNGSARLADACAAFVASQGTPQRRLEKMLLRKPVAMFRERHGR